MAKKLEWSTEKRKVSDLVKLDINPRRITERKKQQLIDLLNKFNLAEIPAINKDNTIISGNQRMEIMVMIGRGEEEIDVRVPNRVLTKKEVKEYAIASNVHQGEFDEEILAKEFSDVDLSILNDDVDLGGMDLNDENPTTVKVVEKELKAYKKSHILISFPPEYYDEVRTAIESLAVHKQIEIEQSSN